MGPSVWIEFIDGIIYAKKSDSIEVFSISGMMVFRILPQPSNCLSKTENSDIFAIAIL
ncbi:hypothetical protein C943_00457 [Mariniradius saccharolyticus AK6]|uniref:Uncharacterized protein n=1 Tax=Mariniradius saccharolyticus AK6 TaxID=1239962 RepID=M7X6V9_9BACT|nr:hypothetical protein C943_00457 [Mariniradius saccharolyticus AK6]